MRSVYFWMIVGIIGMKTTFLQNYLFIKLPYKNDFEKYCAFSSLLLQSLLALK